jgi:hypothetical protein
LLRKALATSFSFGVLAAQCDQRLGKVLIDGGLRLVLRGKRRSLAKLLAVPVGELALHHVPGGKLSKFCIEFLRTGFDGGLRYGRGSGRGGLACRRRRG